MKVILLERVKGTGSKGEVIDVKEGYARNYLFPNNLAEPACSSNLNVLKQKNRANEKKMEQKLRDAQDLAEKLGKVLLSIPVKTGDKGKIFGSITSKHVSQELKKKHNLEIDKKKIMLKDSIKDIGTVEIPVKLHPEVVATLSVKAVDKQTV